MVSFSLRSKTGIYEFETDFSHTTIPGFESRGAGFVFVRLKKVKSPCILGPGFDPAHRVFMSVRLKKCVSPGIWGRNSSDHAFTCPGPRWTRLTARRTPALMVATCVCENDFSFGQNMLCTFLSHFVRCFIPGFGSRELGFVPVRLEKSGCRGIWGPGLNSRQLDFVPVRLEKSGCPGICGPGFHSRGPDK